jgi:hypothetical protein
MYEKRSFQRFEQQQQTDRQDWLDFTLAFRHTDPYFVIDLFSAWLSVTHRYLGISDLGFCM